MTKKSIEKSDNIIRKSIKNVFFLFQVQEIDFSQR